MGDVGESRAGRAVQSRGRLAGIAVRRDAIRAAAWGVNLWTVPPNSQGYLTLGSAALAAQLDLPHDPNDEHWAHMLIEASKVAGCDRPDVLHDGADGEALLAAIEDHLAESPEIAGR